MRFFLYWKNTKRILKTSKRASVGSPNRVMLRPASRTSHCLNALIVGVLTSVLPSAHAFDSDALKVGLAQIDIGSAERLPMGGYGSYFLRRPRLNSSGLHDPLFASALVFESAVGQRAALVVLDAVGLSGTQIARIESAVRRTVDPQMNVIVSATHTHQSPDTLGLWGSLPRSGRNKSYGSLIEAAAVQAVADAFAHRQSAFVTQRQGRHANSTSQLTQPFAVQDSFVSLFFYSQQNSHLIGTFTQWSAHPTVIGMKNNALSSDFISGFRRSLELSTEQVPHIYVNGIIGNVYPVVPRLGDPSMISDLFPEGQRDPDVSFDYDAASTVGFRLAQSVLNAPESKLDAQPETLNACHVAVQFPVGNPLFRLASGLRVIETRIRRGHVGSRVSAITLGRLVFASIPGEVFPNVIHRLSHDVWAGRQPVWMGLGQDWLGYIVDPDDYAKPEFKYWKGLAIHKDGAKVFLEGLSKALKNQGCQRGDPFQTFDSVHPMLE